MSRKEKKEGAFYVWTYDEISKLLSKEEVEISYTGPTIEVGFNAKYFIDVLNAMDSDQVTIELNDKLSPGVMKAVGDDNYVCVVMPMRI